MTSLDLFHLATAVVKFVDYGQRLFSETWHVYRSESGESVEMSKLSAISHDLSQLAATVKAAMKVEQDNGRDPAAPLLHFCGECASLEVEIRRIVQEVGHALQTNRTPKDVRAMSDNDASSLGDTFRMVLKGWRRREEIDRLRDRLSETRNKVVGIITTTVWENTAKTTQWEKDFSKKLDAMISILHTGLDESHRRGPGPTDKDGTKPDRYSRDVSTEFTQAALQRTPQLTDSIKKRLWDRQYKPDPALLASFPQNTSASEGDLIRSISETLRYSSMDQREDSIAKPFDLTYSWIFRQDPLVSGQGEQLWSSFPRWLEEESDTPYWITGKPGSGKSTMMKFIASSSALDGHLRHWSRGSPVHKMRYYAWKPGLELARSTNGLIRTLLHQMMTARPDMTPRLCPRRWALFHTTRTLDPDLYPPWSDWELEECLRLLFDQIKDSTDRLMLLIDGLDEFDVPPHELCVLIERIASHRPIKVCVASRPWPQFSDAFARGPSLQMHRLTHQDISAVVHGSFRQVIAFAELNQLYPNSGDRLLSDIIEKSQGVFLWTTLVTRTLVEALVEGSSLPQLQRILDSLPSEIESLYDAIFSAIPRGLLPDVSAMFQMFVLPPYPPRVETLWLADEIRYGSIQMTMMLDSFDLQTATAALKRRLGARTRGILELQAESHAVEYIHRTAAEWLILPRVWGMVTSLSPHGFDPYYAIARAETLETSWQLSSIQWVGRHNYWRTATRIFCYASRISQDFASDEAITDVLDRLQPDHVSGDASIAFTFESMGSRSTTFMGLACRLAVLPYVRHKLGNHPRAFDREPAGTSPLLEQAIFGIDDDDELKDFIRTNLGWMHVSPSQRLKVVDTLLVHGIRPRKLRQAIERRPDRDEPYFRDVLRLLKRYGYFSAQNVMNYLGFMAGRTSGS